MVPQGSLNSPKLNFMIICSRILELLVDNLQTNGASHRDSNTFKIEEKLWILNVNLLWASFHPLQGAENWLRDPFVASGISLNVSSYWYHYPHSRSLCLVHTLVTEAIAPVSSFINDKTPSFWLLAIVQTRFRNAFCRLKEKSCRRYSTSVGLPKTVPCAEEGCMLLCLSVGSNCQIVVAICCGLCSFSVIS
jgi:hypothetical protein